MNRSRGLAEGVVVMVCPVLLALALDKVDLKVYGRHNFMAMLTMAGVTLISGICPVLGCCFFHIFPNVPYVKPEQVTASMVTLSSFCLLVLACFIAQLIVSKKILIAVGVLCGTFVLVRTVFYYLEQNENGEQYPAVLHDILDESYEFLTGVTGILFLGLEGLALTSHDNQMLQKTVGAVATVSFIVCALGVCLMYFEMTPPQNFSGKSQIVGFTLVLDILMAFGTFVLLIVVMFKLMGIPALVLCTPPAVFIGELVYRVAIHPTPVEITDNLVIQVNGNAIRFSEVSVKDIQVSVQHIQVSGPASLELTRVTFTGFLAVSITANGNTSPGMLTGCFLLFAAAAILFGLSWRLLTQCQIRICLSNLDKTPDIASSAKLASLCTHFCIVIATILFLAMAGTARGK